MKKLIIWILAGVMSTTAMAQTYEGGLRVEYKDELGKANNADIMVKGEKIYIRRAAGGAEKYDAYILDNKTHTLTCLSDKKPKTAVQFNVDKVLAMYEQKKLKPGYRVHEVRPYKADGPAKKIAEINATRKKATSDTLACEIWTADLKINFQALIPVLRVAGFWGQCEDGNNAILQGTTSNTRTKLKTSLTVTPIKLKPEDKMFEVPKDYQVVDLNRFIAEQAQSDKLPSLVSAFAGF